MDDPLDPVMRDPAVLVVGAGPTGLALACQLARFGIRFRIIDRQADRARESRAFAVQARTLELLQALDLGETLVGRGRRTVRLMLHLDQAQPLAVDLGDVGRTDTRFPFVLFVSQAETEAVLTEHLRSSHIVVEHGVELAAFHQETSGVLCTLRHDDGREETLRVPYLAGCDGAHSTVRKGAGIPFDGGAYPQQFALGDVEADGSLVPGAINAFALGRGIALFFPLGTPATWRVMAMDAGAPRSPALDPSETISTHDLSLEALQAMVDDPTRGRVQLRDPAWLTRFRLHHRQAARYRQDRIFLAGDAAHIHSPVGGQGMNTGIQDAWNLGWKLAAVIRGWSGDRLLDSYHAERWPIGRVLLKATDRLFGMLARSLSGGPSARLVRRLLLRRVVAPALSRPGPRRTAFHFVSQLGIRYRSSPAVTEAAPGLRHGPAAGDRLPDARVRRDAHTTYLQQALSQPPLQLLLCGPVGAWDGARIEQMKHRFPELLGVAYLTREDVPGALVDVHDEALKRLGVETTAQYVIRPDGYVGFRCGGTDLAAAVEYLDEWFSPGGGPPIAR